MNIEFGVCAKDQRAKDLMPMIEGWRKAIERFAELDDQPGYYFNERANVGFLAAGAWFAKWAVLEEYTDYKRREKKKGSGRTDLFITDGNNSAVIEAKQLWTASDKAPAVTFNRKLREARADVRAIRHGDAKLACLFLVPHFLAKLHSSEDSSYESAIREYIQGCTTSLPADMWAWCFPKLNRTHRGTERYKSNFYPGVLLAIKWVKYWSH